MSSDRTSDPETMESCEEVSRHWRKTRKLAVYYGELADEHQDKANDSFAQASRCREKASEELARAVRLEERLEELRGEVSDRTP